MMEVVCGEINLIPMLPSKNSLSAGEYLSYFQVGNAENNGTNETAKSHIDRYIERKQASTAKRNATKMKHPSTPADALIEDDENLDQDVDYYRRRDPESMNTSSLVHRKLKLKLKSRQEKMTDKNLSSSLFHNQSQLVFPVHQDISNYRTKICDDDEEIDDDFELKFSLQRRSRGKSTTVIVGMPKYLDTEKIIRALKKKFHCTGCVKTDETYGDVLHLTGDQIKNIHQFFIDKRICRLEQIRINQ